MSVAEPRIAQYMDKGNLLADAAFEGIPEHLVFIPALRGAEKNFGHNFLFQSSFFYQSSVVFTVWFPVEFIEESDEM